MAGDYDVVIVGSGYGGAVCASRLSRAGQRVCVLERGRELLPGDFPTDTASFARAAQVDFPGGHVGDRSALFRFVLDEDCSATMGCALGGTSLINAGVALRPSDAEWNEPRWPAALRADRDTLLAEGFDRATAMLQPTSYPSARTSGRQTPRLAKLDALEAAAQAIGHSDSFSRPPLTIAFEAGKSAAGVDQPACALCGDCLTGCNTGAKTTLLTTYLPDAVAHGAQLFTELDVQFVEKVDGAYNVHFDPIALRRDRFEAPPMFVRAKVVVVAAGALGSAELLLRSRARGLSVSSELGKRFSGNATTLAFGFDHAEEVRAVGAKGEVGPAIAGMIDVREEPKMIIQESAVPSPLGSLVAPLLRAVVRKGTARERLRSIRRALSGASVAHTQCYAVTARDDAGGRLELDDDRIRIRWPKAGLQPIVASIHARLGDATRALGGQLVTNPAWEKLPSHPPMTTHPLGGCAMAEDGAHGVVDDRGRVFSGTGTETHDGLYVCDGSTIPGALGCNPLLAISALAERCAKLVARDRGWSVSYAPLASGRPRPSARRASSSGLRFTERMVGHFTAPAGTSDFSFVCTLVWEDLAALLRDPSVAARSVGTVNAPALSPDPLAVRAGHFQLLVPHEGGHRMVHQLVVQDCGGRRFFLDGYKTIDGVVGRGLWKDTTTLFYTAYEGEDASGARLGEGAARVRLRDLMRQVSTMGGDRARGLVADGQASARFVSSFATRMGRTYVLPTWSASK